MLEYMNQYLNQKKEEMERITDSKLLFGAAGGSFSLGLWNKSSDFDFYIVTEGGERGNIKSVTLQTDTEIGKLDFMCVDIYDIIADVNIYIKETRKYPTCLYRDEKIQREIETQKDLERADFKREIIIRILLADYIWESEKGIILKWYKQIQSGLKLIDIFDYHYNRAYGNFQNYICNKNQVLLRKYLYTIQELSVCKWLLERENKPPMDFARIVKIQKDSALKSKMDDFVCQNKAAIESKKQVFVERDIELNNFIENELAILLENMKLKEEVLQNEYLTVKERV